jgi:hypothetical protein
MTSESAVAEIVKALSRGMSTNGGSTNDEMLAIKYSIKLPEIGAE